MEKSGCAWFVIIPLGIILIVGLWIGGSGAPKEPTPEEIAAMSPPIALVGEYKISADQLREAIDQRNSMTQAEILEPLAEVQNINLALSGLIDRATMLEFAKKEGILLTDASVRTILGKRVKQMRDMIREQLVADKKLAANATDAEFLAAAKKEGQDVEAQEKQAFEQIDQALKDPSLRPQIMESAAQIALQDKYAQKTTVSDADLENSYKQYVFKQIVFNEAKEGAENKKMAEKALAEIKAGKSFEQAMEQYIKTAPPTGKKKSDVTQDLPASFVDTNETYAELRNMKPGEVKLVEMQFGPVLYKFVQEKKELPPDFATKKEDLRKQQVMSKAFENVMKDVEEFKKNVKIKWESPGHEVLHKYMKELQGGKLANKPFAEMKQVLEPLSNEAKTAADSDPEGRRAAVLARYAMLDQLWKNAKTEEEKNSIIEERILAAEEVLAETESPQTRLALAQLYLDKKDPAAIEQVIRAAEGNTSLGPMGQKTDNDIVAMVAKLKAASLGTPDDFQRIEKEHQRWLKDRQAEMAAQAQAMLERQEEERRWKEQEEAEKKAAEAKSREEAEKEKSEKDKQESKAGSNDGKNK